VRTKEGFIQDIDFLSEYFEPLSFEQALTYDSPKRYDKKGKSLWGERTAEPQGGI
jgi:hypothetical protein